jgi:hypothetical protein
MSGGKPFEALKKFNSLRKLTDLTVECIWLAAPLFAYSLFGSNVLNKL